MPMVKVDGVEVQAPQGATVGAAHEHSRPRRSGGRYMTRSLLWLPGLALALTFTASPAVAGKNDDAWAKCIWEQVPESASNWLKMPAPKQSYGLADAPPEYVLQFRLQAACYDRMIPAGKKSPPRFGAKAVRAALEAQRPSSPGTDKVDPKAYRCTRYFLNDTEMKNPAGFDWGFGTDTSKAQFFAMTFLYSAKGGYTGLPTKGGLRKCAFIKADGTFADA